MSTGPLDLFFMLLMWGGGGGWVASNDNYIQIIFLLQKRDMVVTSLRP